MSVIRFDPNTPVEVALKYDGGKQVQSRIPEAPDQMMYTVCGDDTIYVPLHVADQITQLGIKRAELMSICKRQQSGVTRWEVKRISEAAEPARPEATMLENQLTRSIEQANQQKAQRALQAPAGPQSTQAVSPSNPTTPNSTPPIAHTVISKIMASALIASIDATQEAERYAHSKGFELEFGADDIRAIAATIFITASKQAPSPADTPNAGGATWRQ